MTTTETIREIKGYEGLYEVDALGNVYSLVGWNVHSGYVYRLRKMKGFDNGKGYKVVTLKKDGYRKNFYIHRLVADAFLERPDGCDVVNHLDHDRSNNSASNLEWTTQKENVLHSAHLMRKPRVFKTACGEHHIREKKGGYEVALFGKYIGRYKTLSEACSARDTFLAERGWFCGEVDNAGA